MAAEQAEGLLSRLGLQSAPIDPLAVAASEAPLLVVRSGDFRNRFDGQLEYHRSKNRFLLLYNTKYDRPGGNHHPRTRFSIAHELGHFFLERHHAYLVKGGSTHRSKAEFFSDNDVEREADAFACGLLMPTPLMEPLVNNGELDPGRIRELADHFQTSLVSTAIRSVRLSDFPCALVGIRDGLTAWSFLSKSLRERGCYPAERDRHPPSAAARHSRALANGSPQEGEGEGELDGWLRTYGKEALEGIPVTEYFLPVPAMNTLVVLLAASEEDVYRGDDEEDSAEED